MGDQENVKAALEAVASNPKVASIVAAANITMGAASILNDIQTVLGLISLAIGCGVGLYAFRIQQIKHKIYQRMLENGESLKE